MNKTVPDLSSLQAAMMDTLYGAEPASHLVGCIRSPSNHSVEESLSIYRHSMQSTLINTLRLSYPTVEHLVGKEFFTAAAKRFVRRTPSRNGDLDRYGDAFAEHLGGLPGSPELSWLADLARFERLLHELHRRAPEPVLTRGDLAAADIGRLADSSLTLTRRAGLFESRWPVARIWLAHRDNPEDPDFDGVDATADRALACASEPTRILLLEDAAWTFFKALDQGNPLLTAVERACAIDPAFDFQTTFGAALDCGAFASADR